MAEIIIKYKEETLDTENFTEREKAIYQAGFNEALDEKEIKEKTISFIIAISIVVAAYLGLYHLLLN